jgi:hypothetical protein
VASVDLGGFATARVENAVYPVPVELLIDDEPARRLTMDSYLISWTR